ncbi:Protein LURP-one-related 15 [Acorus calamus]|uniref:Protein LURP-one-related 15 n=1 Tax=Acorus calamus TaxID=4465 RepID=A0AAV9C594_ACOCL|nr:Protein LURP-one-related 15 [Acorus calamus]
MGYPPTAPPPPMGYPGALPPMDYPGAPPPMGYPDAPPPMGYPGAPPPMGYPPSAPPPTLPAGCVAVVGQQYCAPYVVDLTVRKKALSLSRGDFVVTDVNGALLLKVQGKVFSIIDRRVLVDGTGNPIVTMRRKMMTVHDLWEVYRGESMNSSDLLFSAKKSSFIQPLKTQLDVFLVPNTGESVCDFKVKSGFFERSYTICIGESNTIIAQMRRKYTVSNVLLGRDTFRVTVYPNIDYAFIVALVVILDEINRGDDDL